MHDKFEEILDNEYNDFLNSKGTVKNTAVWCGNGRIENSRFRFNIDINAEVLKAMIDKTLTVTILPSKTVKFGNTHSAVVANLPLMPLENADADGIIARVPVQNGKFTFALTFDMIKELAWTSETTGKKKMTLEAIGTKDTVVVVRFLNAGHPQTAS